MGNNLIFIGMPAVGKSTVGVIIAKRLGYQFVDTDLLIQKEEKRLLKEIMSHEGIDGFLRIENRVNSGINAEKSVISPGGSVVYCKEAMDHFKNIGTIVYLQISFANISKRLHNPENRGVVLKEGQSLEELYNERVQLFEHYADITINVDECVLDNTVAEIMRVLKQVI